MNFRFSDIVLKAAILPVLIALGGCASDRALVTLNPVGPDSRGSGGGGPGHLIVYSATCETVDPSGAMAYPHSAYKIENERGACIKRVRNRSGAEGEIPDRVDLPPGRYTVIAQSETQGLVAAPVIIKSQLTTVVKLEKPPRVISPGSMAAN